MIVESGETLILTRHNPNYNEQHHDNNKYGFAHKLIALYTLSVNLLKKLNYLCLINADISGVYIFAIRNRPFGLQPPNRRRLTYEYNQKRP
jgi:hypothetical protein